MCVCDTMSVDPALDTSFSPGDAEDFADTITNLDANHNGAPKVDTTKFPVKKLSDVFEALQNQATKDKQEEEHMKVYLRVRPSSSKHSTESTINVESETSIVTNAPESSKRAQYTKTEERHYVSDMFVMLLTFMDMCVECHVSPYWTITNTSIHYCFGPSLLLSFAHASYDRHSLVCLAPLRSNQKCTTTLWPPS